MNRLSYISTEDIKKELKRRKKCENNPYKIIILLGPPGSGKGTQASMLSNEFCYCKFSSGDIFRKHIMLNTKLGIEAKIIMDQGELISDELAYKMLNVEGEMEKEYCKYGIIFDGFPRTTSHAVYLQNILHEKRYKELLTHHINTEDSNNEDSELLKKEVKYDISKVLVLNTSEDSLVKRVSGRLLHVASGRTYHELFNPPKVDGKDDHTGEVLVKRIDDKMILKRIRLYNTETAPLINYYKALVSNIDADQDMISVNQEIKRKLNLEI